MGRPSSIAPARPPEARTPLGARPTPQPLLASEVLRDEVAPREPSRAGMRVLLLVVAAILLLLGWAFRAGAGLPSVRQDAAFVAFSAAAAAAALGICPFPYGVRAGVATVLGLALFVLGFRTSGPLYEIALDGGLSRDLARIVACTLLPAGVLLRAAYRQYAPARWALGLTWLSAAPYAVVAVSIAAASSAPPLSRAAAALGAVAVLVCTLGFVPHITTGLAGLLAAFVLLVLPLEIGVRELGPLAGPDAGALTFALGAAGLFVAAALTSVGLFQSFAVLLAPAARRSARVSPAEDEQEELEQRSSVG